MTTKRGYELPEGDRGAAAPGQVRQREPAAIGRFLSGPDARFGLNVASATLLFLILVRVMFPAPPAILALGAVLGSLSALIAMGLVLVYRANRILNFAQGELGAVAGLLSVLLLGDGWPFFAAIGAGLLAAIVVGGLVEFLFVRRFAQAPRLILTVATIGIASILVAGELALPSAFGEILPPQDFPTPFDFSFKWHPMTFQGSHAFAVLVVIGCGVGLFTFLRFTRVGIAIRAASESSERARQLGVPAARINLVVWMLAAGLAGVASLLRAPIVGVPVGEVLGPVLLVRAMAAAVVGRMESLPVTFVAAVVLGMVEQAVFWHTGRSLVTDLVLFVVILGALLIQRRRRDRADDAKISTWQAVGEVRPIPPELLGIPLVRYGRRGVVIAVGAALVIGPLFIAPSRVNLLGTGVILALVGASLLILMGWAGEISLGQMALFGFGAATAAKLAAQDWNILICLLAAGLVGSAAALVIGIPALRIRGPFLAVSSFAFALATSSYLLNPEFMGWFVETQRVGRPVLFGKFDLESEHAYYFALLGLLVVVALSLRSIRRSRIGRVLVAVRDNARGAESFGINVVRARIVAFIFSGFLAGLAGAAFAFHQHAVGQGSFTPEQSLRIFSMVVFGGLGSFSGVLLGAAYFTALDFFVPLAQTRLLVSGAGLLFVLLILPGGLSQLVYQVRDGVLRRIAQSRQILVPSLVADASSPLVAGVDRAIDEPSDGEVTVAPSDQPRPGPVPVDRDSPEAR